MRLEAMMFILRLILIKCSSLIGAAPALLSTSVELATALGDDSNYATTMQNKSNTKVNINDT